MFRVWVRVARANHISNFPMILVRHCICNFSEFRRLGPAATTRKTINLLSSTTVEFFSYLSFVLKNGRLQFSDGRHVLPNWMVVGIDARTRAIESTHFTRTKNPLCAWCLFGASHFLRKTLIYNLTISVEMEKTQTWENVNNSTTSKFRPNAENFHFDILCQHSRRRHWSQLSAAMVNRMLILYAISYPVPYNCVDVCVCECDHEIIASSQLISLKMWK